VMTRPDIAVSTTTIASTIRLRRRELIQREP
jgi:hypothetical protein